jgi:UPF0716 family protein affecting phage T7 exclusion
MLNYRLLYILISPGSAKTFLGLAAGLGFAVLIDVIIFLKLALLIGPWITMALLAAGSAAGIFFMYQRVGVQGRRLTEAVDDGRFVPGILSRYLSVLAASVFLILPGFVNSLAGIVLLIPYVAEKTGDRLARMAGIDWREAYEFLRLNRLAGVSAGESAES